MKLGVIEDSANRTRLGKLLRFQSSADKEKLTSLSEYIERMKEKQEHIYYIAGASRAEVGVRNWAYLDFLTPNLNIMWMPII